MNLERIVIVCCSAATVGTGLAGGIFFAFSSFVMRALGAVPPRAGIAAMNAINVTVINPGFMLVFLGTAVLSVGLALASFRWWGSLDGALLLVASLLYLVGCLGVTMVRNVPLNDALAALGPDPSDSTGLWSRYLVEWTRWNHVRTLSCLGSTILLVTVLVRRAGG
ncbi:MAG TPA: anthrone oxygenase family protein [Myxococcaceae bacterium]|nr:anthrone oxygenase family protein [Myxococcaceae bacterium]